ncbi:MAG: BrnT family toxin [Pseudomonadales bacterium]|nr:BrnT family toxin [Candidatus Woesebacteria bacterium]MCB9801954.1 BrnT family toxin [Pseudomonadales bacterium]
MKYYSWNLAKNQKLQAERKISFEEIVSAIAEGKLLAVEEHSNQEKYEKQNIFIVEMHDYAYLVPFVEDNTQIFLKTIIPSRKQQKNT